MIEAIQPANAPKIIHAMIPIVPLPPYIVATLCAGLTRLYVKLVTVSSVFFAYFAVLQLETSPVSHSKALGRVFCQMRVEEAVL